MEKYHTFDLDAEWCCEMCNETYHNHFSCPICKKYTGTNLYSHWDSEIDEEIKCEECGARFKFIEGNPYFEAKWILMT